MVLRDFMITKFNATLTLPNDYFAILNRCLVDPRSGDNRHMWAHVGDPLSH